MNHFFDEFLYKKNEFNALNKAYEGVFASIQSQIHEVEQNMILSKALTFKRVSFQVIDATETMYTLPSLLNNPSALAVMGLPQSAPYDVKLSTWHGLKPIQKSEVLDMCGFSILLTSFSAIGTGNEYEKVKFQVIDFELSDMDHYNYTKNIDYVFRDNKIFILKPSDKASSKLKKTLVLKNIVIDTNLTEDLLGVPLNIPYSKHFTKVEYAEILRSFIAAAAGGPTLEKLNNSLSRYKTLSGVKVYDKYSAPETKKGFWGSDTKIGELTAFDFLISLPVNFLYDSDKLEYVYSFFNQIKPAYTSYIFAPKMDIIDKLILKFKSDTLNFSSSKGIKDKLPSTDNPAMVAALEVCDVTDNIELGDKGISVSVDSEITDILPAKDIATLLNKAPCYDKIVLTEAQEQNIESQVIDKIHVPSTNVAYYDDVFFCDDATGIYFDRGEDGRSRSYVVMKFIPKQ